MTPQCLGALASAGLVVTLFGTSEPLSARQSTSVQAPPQHQHEHARAADVAAGERATLQKRGAMMARLATLDARIEMFVAEMNSFTGDMKVEAMAAVLTALIERQSMMRDEMMEMHAHMMRQMTGRMMSDAPSEAEPSEMCRPEVALPQR